MCPTMQGICNASSQSSASSPNKFLPVSQILNFSPMQRIYDASGQSGVCSPNKVLPTLV